MDDLGRNDARRGAAVATLILGTGCWAARPAPPPLTPPRVETRLEHFEGTPIVGPRAPEELRELRPEDALTLSVRLTYTERFEPGELGLLLARTRLVASVDDRAVLRAVPFVGTEARVASGAPAEAYLAAVADGAAGRSLPLVTYRGALPVGVTAQLRSWTRQAVDVPGYGEVRREVSLLVSRLAEDEIAVALESETLVPPLERMEEHELFGDADAPPPDLEPERWSDLLILEEAPAIDGPPLVTVFPSPFPGHDGAFVVTFRVGSPPDADPERARHEDAVARCRDELVAAARRAQERPDDIEEARRAARRRALSALALDPHRRRSLLFLVDQVDARIAGDVVLAADDAALVELLGVLRAQLDAGPSAEEPAWRLDGAVLGWMAEAVREDRLPPELDSVLVRHAGEVARFPAVLGGLARSCETRAAFEELLREEHLLLLEDSSPATRVRAFEWLDARAEAPAGFDPLGGRDVRRAVLRAYWDARESAESAEPPAGAAP